MTHQSTATHGPNDQCSAIQKRGSRDGCVNDDGCVRPVLIERPTTLDPEGGGGGAGLLGGGLYRSSLTYRFINFSNCGITGTNF